MYDQTVKLLVWLFGRKALQNSLRAQIIDVYIPYAKLISMIC